MNQVVDLRVNNAEVWAYICKLQSSAPVGKVLSIRCKGCGAQVGTAASTPSGPGFSSVWKERSPMGVAWVENGKTLGARETVKRLTRAATEETGDWGECSDIFFAPLAIPTNLPQDYLPLLVRCAKHGDAFLEREDILSALRAGKTQMIAEISGATVEVISQQTEGLAGSATKTSSLTLNSNAL